MIGRGHFFHFLVCGFQVNDIVTWRISIGGDTGQADQCRLRFCVRRNDADLTLPSLKWTFARCCSSSDMRDYAGHLWLTETDLRKSAHADKTMLNNINLF
ncbi:MAG: hypothetical protein BGO52_12015 [Sphingobacteriales bacterium 44-61]|nr:MAG: hypothetical protein BGO52_12015 [Sphingobacteriales bacterium 44-61]